MERSNCNTILILGGTGTIGKYLVSYFSSPDLDNFVISLNRNEHNHVLLKKEFSARSNINYVIGDIRDKELIKSTILKYKPNVIINTAALKHIDICEANIEESIKTNVQANVDLLNLLSELHFLWTDNKLINIFISTDKVVNPSTVYGMCKGISEVLYTSFTGYPTINSCVCRFGNILNSSGSIIPILKSLARKNSTISLTDPNMTRFMVPLPKLAQTICSIINMSQLEDFGRGKVVVSPAPSFRLGDLAEVILESERSSSKLEIIGHRAGEKVHEELIPKSEFGILSNKYETLYQSVKTEEDLRKFNSEFCVLSAKDKLANYLRKYGCIE